MRELFEANEIEALKDDKAKAAMMLRHTTLERNKRCLLAYLNHRIEKIRDMRWQFGAVLPSDVKVLVGIFSKLSISEFQILLGQKIILIAFYSDFRPIFANLNKHFSQNTIVIWLVI